MTEYGYNVDIDEEIMLIFGGLTQRKRSFQSEDGEFEVYNYCEKYQSFIDESELPYSLLTCGVEMLNDIWMYNTRDVQHGFITMELCETNL